MERAPERQGHLSIAEPAHLDDGGFEARDVEGLLQAVGRAAHMNHDVRVATRIARLRERNTERLRNALTLRVDVDQLHVAALDARGQPRHETAHCSGTNHHDVDVGFLRIVADRLRGTVVDPQNGDGTQFASVGCGDVRLERRSSGLFHLVLQISRRDTGNRHVGVRQASREVFRRFARALAKFPRGLYLSDLILREGNTSPIISGFGALLGVFVRGRVHVDFANAADVEATLAAAGLSGVVLDPRDFAFELPRLETAGAGVVRIIEAMPT